MLRDFAKLIKELVKDTFKSLKKDPISDLRYERYDPSILGNKLRNENYHDL